MKKTKIFFLSCILFVFCAIAIMFSYNSYKNQNLPFAAVEELYDNNYNYDDQEVAEKFAIAYYVANAGQLLSVEKTFYDAKINRYIVFMRGDEDNTEDNTMKMIIVGVTNGKVSSFDSGDGRGESLALYATSVTEETPDNIVYDIDIP